MNSANSTRRDPRHELPGDTSIVEFPEPLSGTKDLSAVLTRISVAGLAFETTSSPTLHAGAIIKGVTVRVGDCRLHGDLVVQYLETAKSPDVEAGCLFYPSGAPDADRLMALIAGIEVARIKA